VAPSCLNALGLYGELHRRHDYATRAYCFCLDPPLPTDRQVSLVTQFMRDNIRSNRLKVG